MEERIAVYWLLKSVCENLEMSLSEMLACITKYAAKGKKNPIEYKSKQKWDSSFGVVGRLEETRNAIYPE